MPNNKVFIGKEGDIVVDGINYNDVIKQFRVTESITAVKRFTATSKKPVETIQSNINVAGELMVALVDPVLWELRKRPTPFDCVLTTRSSDGRSLDIRVINCRGEGDSELAVEEEAEDGIHFPLPFQADEVKLLTV